MFSVSAAFLERAAASVRSGTTKVAACDAGGAFRHGVLCDSRVPGSVLKGFFPAADLHVADAQKLAAIVAGFGEMILAVAPHASGNRVQEYYKSRELHGMNIKIFREDKIKGNLGTLNQLFALGAINLDTVDTVGILFADTIHNYELLPMLASHLETGADLTIAGYILPWSDADWDVRSFGVSVLEHMPERQADESFESFNQRMENFLDNVRGNSVPVTEFSEKFEDPTLFRRTAKSPVIYAGVAFMSARLAKALRDAMSQGLIKDIGLELLKLLTGEISDQLRAALPKELLESFEGRKFKFNCFVLPKENSKGQKIYYQDIADPPALLKLQRQILTGAIAIRAGDPGASFWNQLHPTGYIGTSNATLDGVDLPQLPQGNSIGPFLGSHGSFRRSKIDPLNVIGDYTCLDRSEIAESLIFGGTDQQKVLIDGFNLYRCIVMGPLIMRATGTHHRLGGKNKPSFDNAIIYRNPDDPNNDPECWTYLPINSPFGLSSLSRTR
ncbi:MAG: hypothetical protein WC624_03255 [Candidatus Margulisiibacteriota bacterium]